MFPAMSESPVIAVDGAAVRPGGRPSPRPRWRSARCGRLALAYAIPSLPPSSAIVAVAVGVYYVSAMLA
jgi:hypothetical protein